ncbi:hypothetical protein VTN77DRAFT_7831 [Rasamsonia byssochlamydoides]|uniref:uncharacterized protein n=1 Tax=Rasamsonia byssochlamydoides TaxID=89139 RepID=UPI0037439DAA
MFPPRSSVRRIPGLIRPLRPPSDHKNPLSRPRPFTNKSKLHLVSPPLSRPQLPFLSPLAGNRPLPPLSTHLRQHFARLISTEQRDYYKRRLRRGLRIAVTVYAIICLFHLMKIGVYQEEIEHKWPTPPEWSWKSRWCLRSAEALQHPEEIGKLMTNWPAVAGYLRELIERLENPEGEGKGIVEQGDGGILVEGVGKTGYDVSMKSEPWRRGYFQALMGAARAAENLEGWMTDRKRRISAPAEYVVGPSNPRPKPLPARQKQVLLEEDCEPASESPEVFYIKILTTKGFSTKQKVDAALAYADWLDYKGLKGTARDMYSWAMDIAAAGLPFDAARVVDTKTGILKTNNRDVASENIMRVSTALAVHHARSGDLQTALSIFTSVLKARRGLPEQDTSSKKPRPTSQTTGSAPFGDLVEKIKTILVPVTYPDAPSDGNDPPVRTVGSACEEAGLMTYIGEIIYASSSQENGLSWTRDAVDMAESTFIELGNDREYAAARERCTQCLKVGLDNWKTMVRNLVVKAEKEEAEAMQKAEKAWYGGEKRVQAKTLERKRWEAEEMIVQERANRLLPLIDDGGLASGNSLFI